MNKKQKIGEFIVMALFGFVASDVLQYYESMFSQFAYSWQQELNYWVLRLSFVMNKDNGSLVLSVVANYAKIFYSKQIAM